MSQFLGENGISAADHLPYSPDLVPVVFWLFIESWSMLKGKHFFDIEDIKSSMKEVWHSFLFRILKAVLNNGQSARNIIEMGGRLF
jgi:hypothetical protein